MTETIETGLVYIHRLSPTPKFIGCGALIEGRYIATCRHVWRDATNSGATSEIGIEYPRSYRNGSTITSNARLTDACEETDRPSPDLVLLQPETIPTGVMTLQLAREVRHETGPGYAHARLTADDPNGSEKFRESFPKGEIDDKIANDGLRLFSGNSMHDYWFSPGSSGSPIFREGGAQLAGILSLAHLNSTTAPQCNVAFVVPATTILAIITLNQQNRSYLWRANATLS